MIKLLFDKIFSLQATVHLLTYFYLLSSSKVLNVAQSFHLQYIS